MNETHTVTVREQISALADGQLRGEALVRVIDQIGGSPELRATWRAYHLVGDVLRSGGHAVCSEPSVFLSRLQGRLAAEPAHAPLGRDDSRPAPVPVERIEAANEPVFRWKLVAGVASLAAVAAIGWNWVGAPDARQAGAQLALQQQSAPAVVVAAQQAPANAMAPTPTPATQVAGTLTPTRVLVGSGNPQVMLRDPRLDQLLEAHQQAGGASQMPSGFQRNATFERPSR
ncbi:MAG TPA: RseA family anti-sigma factor [Variovorax sp.]